jgi:hypothetical protein
MAFYGYQKGKSNEEYAEGMLAYAVEGMTFSSVEVGSTP